MDNLFMILFLLSFLAMFVFVILSLMQFVKKDKIKGLKQIKLAGVSTGIALISFIGFGITSDSTTTSNSDKTEPVAVVDAKEEVKEEEPKETEEERIAREQKEAEEKVAAEKKAKEEADAKAKDAADKLVAEKEFYLNNVKTAVDTQLGMYDAAWNEIWQPTFEGVGNGTVNVYTAYDNMKKVEQRYDTLYSSFGAIESKGLSKENKKLFDEFKSSIKSAAMFRGEAAEKAKKMFDEGDFSPSKFDKVKADISYADREMLSAIVALTSLEMNLGVERDQ